MTVAKIFSQEAIRMAFFKSSTEPKIKIEIPDVTIYRACELGNQEECKHRICLILGLTGRTAQPFYQEVAEYTWHHIREVLSHVPRLIKQLKFSVAEFAEALQKSPYVRQEGHRPVKCEVDAALLFQIGFRSVCEVLFLVIALYD